MPRRSQRSNRRFHKAKLRETLVTHRDPPAGGEVKVRQLTPAQLLELRRAWGLPVATKPGTR